MEVYLFAVTNILWLRGFPSYISLFLPLNLKYPLILVNTLFHTTRCVATIPPCVSLSYRPWWGPQVLYIVLWCPVIIPSEQGGPGYIPCFQWVTGPYWQAPWGCCRAGQTWSGLVCLHCWKGVLPTSKYFFSSMDDTWQTVGMHNFLTLYNFGCFSLKYVDGKHNDDTG